VSHTTLEALGATLKSKAQENPDLTVLVRADEAIAYGKVVAVLRLIHDAEISRMGARHRSRQMKPR
jgi:biopolymer transport protein ExbD